MKDKVQTSWSEIKEELNLRLDAFGGSYAALSRLSGIDYHAARRLLRSGATNDTENARKAALALGIENYESAKVQKCGLNDIVVLLEDVWDGSSAHAELICQLIQSTRLFKVEDRHTSKK